MDPESLRTMFSVVILALFGTGILGFMSGMWFGKNKPYFKKTKK